MWGACVLQEHRAQARALKKVMEDKFAEAHRAFARGETILGRQLIERVSCPSYSGLAWLLVF
jgi:hypothetical protein